MARFQQLSSRAIMGQFYMLLEQGDNGWANRLAFPVESNMAQEDYAWLGMSPVMREWIGGRQAKSLREEIYSIRNKKWEATLEIDVDDLRRDKTGQIMVRVNELAGRANSHWARLISQLINAGGSTLCYDGQFFFDTDHLEGESGLQSNDIQVDISAVPVNNHGSVAAPSVGEMNEVIMTSVETMLGFKDDQGEPLNEGAKDFIVQVPTRYWKTSIAAVSSAIIDSGATNVITSMNGLDIQIVMNPRLTSADQIATFRADGNVKPFIRQEEYPVEITAIAEGSELEFKEDKHWYGLKSSGNAGYGYWQHAVRTKLI